MIYIDLFDLNTREFNTNATNANSDFTINHSYKKDDKFEYQGKTYQVAEDFTSGDKFEISTKFLSIGKSNKTACIDKEINTKTTKDDELEISFDNNMGDILFLQNCNFKELNISLVQNDNEIYKNTFSMLESMSIKEYMLGIREYKSQIVIYLPMTLNGKITITMKDTGNIVSIGNILFGRAENGGISLAKEPEPNLSFIDLEYFKRDSYGKLTVNNKEVPNVLKIGIIYLGDALRKINILKRLKKKMLVWLPLTNNLSTYGEIKDNFAIYGALTNVDANLISGLGFNETWSIESTI